MKPILDIYIDGYRHRNGTMYAMLSSSSKQLHYTSVQSVTDASFEKPEQAQWLALLYAYKFSDIFSLMGFDITIHTHSRTILNYYKCGFHILNEIPDSEQNLYPLAGYTDYLPTFCALNIVSCKSSENIAHELIHSVHGEFCSTTSLHIYDKELAKTYDEYLSMPDLKKTILKLQASCEDPSKCTQCEKNLSGLCDVPLMKELYTQKYHETI